MFLGQFHHSVDSKGRVAIPAQFRRDLAGGAVLSLGQEGRLVIWPPDAWEEYAQNFRLTSSSLAEQRSYMRFLNANSRQVELDAQGRVLLSPEHRQFAGISERAVFVGMGNCVEIASGERWDADSQGLTPELFTELGDRINTSGAGAPTTSPA